ncbi:MAG: Holliday junction resolvase RuvX [Muribaculaceae bacterium]
MGRLLAIDYGRKRCGIAVTDVLKIVATGLTTVATHQLVQFLKDYTAKEPVDKIVVGLPKTVRGEASESMNYITPGVNKIKKELPGMEIVFFDERFTSVLAHKSMLESGMKKSDRQNKAVVDEISATIILNDYLQSKLYNQ